MLATSRAPTVIRRTTRSPGRAAADLEPTGWRILLPLAHLVVATLGLAGLVAAGVGFAVMAALRTMAETVAAGPVPATGPNAAVVLGATVGGALLLAWGTTGMARASARDRRRRRLVAAGDRGAPPAKVRPLARRDDRAA
jgi:hypothetical protein